MPGSAHVIRADAGHIPLPDESVDLIVTSPPYWAQRSYRDHGEHYKDQIGSEPHPRYWLEAMFAVMRECWRVLKPGGSCFVNLGDKRAGSGGHNNSGIVGGPTGATSILAGRSHTAERDRTRATRRTAPDRYEQAHFGRVKSRQALPERFLIGCIDGLADPEGIGWIWRSPLYAGDDDWGSPRLWWKANSIPESVTDRTRDDWEHVFHLTRQERYYSAVDEIRESQIVPNAGRNSQVMKDSHDGTSHRRLQADPHQYNPLGKLPGSVWRIASEPLKLPTWKVVRAGRTVQWFTGKEDDAYALALKWMRAMGTSGGRPSLRRVTSHFAAFPTELPRRIILGFSPSAICTACSEGRRPVVEKDRIPTQAHHNGYTRGDPLGQRGGMIPLPHRTEATILGYACACTPYTDHPERRGKSFVTHGADETLGRSQDGSARNKAYREGRAGPSGATREYHFAGWTPPPTRPALVLDPFAGTGTTMLVAKALGRTGIGVDLSHSYSKVAQWRCNESGQGQKAESRTWREHQQSLL